MPKSKRRIVSPTLAARLADIRIEAWLERRSSKRHTFMTTAEIATMLRLGSASAARATSCAGELAAWDSALAAFMTV